MYFPFPFKSDSYKYSHPRQYRPGTTVVESYFESRGGEFSETIFFGPQLILKEHFVGQVVTAEAINHAEVLLKDHFGGRTVFQRHLFEHILNQHRGYLPLRVMAAPEGLSIPTSNVLMKVRNTCPQCYWLTNFSETLLVQSWYPTTVATLSRNIKKLILAYLNKTGDPAGIDFKLHDFGFRGVSSTESAAIGGLAHLTSFAGSDTIVALLAAMQFYKHPSAAAFSIPASEHSSITSWGQENEVDACRNMLEQFPDGLVACVSDSYDIRNCVQNIWGGVLKNAVAERDGCLVVRPDSGYPPHVVLDVVYDLGQSFGYTVNAKGYKVLSPKVRVIQGDGVNYQMIDQVLAQLTGSGWSADNVTFGMGGALLQKLHRDSQKMAFKCCYTENPMGNIDVYKMPVTDKTKASKAGILALVPDEELKYNTVRAEHADGEDILRTIFLNGEMVVEDDLQTIRARANTN